MNQMHWVGNTLWATLCGELVLVALYEVATYHLVPDGKWLFVLNESDISGLHQIRVILLGCTG